VFSSSYPFLFFLPGKDVFELDKLIFPINRKGNHWVLAVAFKQAKRIQFYDSLGGDGMEYLKIAMRFIKHEHKVKKKSPLPDEAVWQLVPCEDGTPRQLNFHDCGVFTCMFAGFVSLDLPFVFGQDHMTRCRERIALSIFKGTAIKYD
jgi:sentrin-specific protease 1